MRLKGGGIHLGYHTHYVVDGGKRRIILAVLVVPGEVMDNHPLLDLLWHVLFRWRTWPNQVDFRYDLWNCREHQGHRRRPHPGLCSLTRLGTQDPVLWTGSVHL